MSDDITTNDDDTTTEAELSPLDTMKRYAGLQPFVIYTPSYNNKLQVAILEGVKPNGYIKVRKQGIRKGEEGFNAHGTAKVRRLIPVLAFVEEELADEMKVSVEALALGEAALKALNPAPAINPLVDTVVTEYEESAPVEREFFLPEQDKYLVDLRQGGGFLVDLEVPTPASTEQEEALQELMGDTQSPSEGDSMSIEENHQEPVTTPVVEVAGVAGDAIPSEAPAPIVSVPTTEPLDTLEPGTTVVPQPDVEWQQLEAMEPGILEDGNPLPFDPEVHVVPTDTPPIL